jgi:hypothetical protein
MDGLRFIVESVVLVVEIVVLLSVWIVVSIFVYTEEEIDQFFATLGKDILIH